MTAPQHIKIIEYNYDLPASKIAEYPLDNRDESKLLVSKRGNNPEQYYFKNIPEYLPENSVLILNDTRVIYARMMFQKISGAKIEVFCLNPLFPTHELQAAFGLQSSVIWECLVGNARRWKDGVLTLEKETEEGKFILNAEKLSVEERSKLKPSVNTNQLIKFSWTPAEKNFSSIIELFGTVPLPPYIHRESSEADKTTYQTVYAKQQGSVAAPTAGLHFTSAVFNALQDKGIDIEYLTLHVGAGTFKPVTAEIIGDHKMHAEPFEISISLLENLLLYSDRPVIAVGTTSVRTLESVFLAGLRLLNGMNSLENLVIEQWEPYSEKRKVQYSKSEVLQSLIHYLKKNNKDKLSGYTQLLIAPGYSFGIVNGIITNFHQPGSTLLLLIAAFIGEDWKKIYQYALKNNFRFLSYGDSCLLL